MLIVDSSFSTLIAFYSSPVMLWVMMLLWIFLILAYQLQYHPKSKISFLYEYLYESIYDFYESITGRGNAAWIKTYVVSLFFVIFIANILGIAGDFIAPIFWVNAAGNFYLTEIFIIPSADIHFNLALAVLSVLILLVVQFQGLGTKGFFSHYFPIAGNGYMTLQKSEMKPFYFYLLSPFVKAFDILVSLFLWILDIIGLLAKVVSLSFRLFGNIISGGVLLTMMIVGLSEFTAGFTGFLWGVQFPVVLPIILYAQSLLVACVQAMVFALLVAIFIRVSQVEVS